MSIDAKTMARVSVDNLASTEDLMKKVLANGRLTNTAREELTRVADQQPEKLNAVGKQTKDALGEFLERNAKRSDVSDKFKAFAKMMVPRLSDNRSLLAPNPQTPKTEESTAVVTGELNPGDKLQENLTALREEIDPLLQLDDKSLAQACEQKKMTKEYFVNIKADLMAKGEGTGEASHLLQIGDLLVDLMKIYERLYHDEKLFANIEYAHLPYKNKTHK